MKQVLPNVIRTVIPVIAGSLVTYAAKAGFNLDNELAAAITLVVVTGLYQWLGRWLEVNSSSRWGSILLALGLTTKTPKYE